MKLLRRKLFGKSKADRISQLQKLSREWSKQFVGRGNELDAFKNLLTQGNQEEWIIEVQGIGGVGKSTLLLQFSNIAVSMNAKIAITDHRQTSVLDVLQKIAEELELLGSKLVNYSRKRERLSELRYEIAHDQDPKKPEQISEWFGESVAELGSLASKLNPTTELIMQAGGREAVKQLTEGITEYLYRKLSRSDAELMLQPDLLITREFMKDLENVLATTKVILCFDTYEQTKNIIEQWLLDILIPSLTRLSNIYVIVSGREMLSENWKMYRPVISEIHLKPFSYEETTNFLTTKGITSIDRVNEFFIATKGVPLLLQWETINPEKVSSSSGKVNLFLNSIPDSVLRESVIICAIPRYFNKDVVKVLVRGSNAGELFDAIRGFPGVFERERYWEFHELIRESILDYKKKEAPAEYKEYHNRAYEYYSGQIRMQDNTLDVYNDSELKELKAEQLYHLFNINESKAIEQYKIEFARSMARWDEKVLATLLQIANVVELKPENREIIRLLAKSKSNVDKRNLSEALSGLEYLANVNDLSIDEKCMILRAIGIIHLNEKRYSQAREIFEKVIELLPDHPQAYGQLAKVHLENNESEKAIQIYKLLADRNKTVELAALLSIGLIYLKELNFEETENVINDLERLSQNCIESFVLSVAMKEKQEAWDEAIAIHKKIGETHPENYIQAQFNIAKIYIVLENLEMVYQLASELITNVPNEAMGYYLMAAFYAEKRDNEGELKMLLEVSKRSPLLASPIINQKVFAAIQQGQFEKMINLYSDFEEAIVDEDALISLGLERRISGETDKAITLFRKILQQNPSSILAHCNLGDVFWDEGDLDKAIFHFEKAYSIDNKLKSVITPLTSLYKDRNRPEKIESLGLVSSESEDGQVVLIAHSLAGHIHIPRELLELKQKFYDRTFGGDLQTILGQIKIFLLLDMISDVLKLASAVTTSIFGRQDITQEVANSIDEFMATESIEDQRKLMKGSFRALPSIDDAYRDLDSITNQNYAIVAERYCNIGMIARTANQLGLAERCFQNAKAIYPKLPFIYIELGLLNLDKGKREAGMEEFRKLASENPQSIIALIGRLITNNYFEEVDEVAAYSPDIYNNLENILGSSGLNFSQQGLFEQAEKCFLKIIEKNPSIERAYLDLADIYKVTNQNGKYINILDKLLKENPNSQEAKRRLLAIESNNKRITSNQEPSDLEKNRDENIQP